MKRYFISIAVGGALVCAGKAVGQNGAQVPVQPTIQVSGKAQIRVAPDLVDMRFKVDLTGKELLSTQNEQKTRIAAVIAALKKAGIADKDLQTDQVSIYPLYPDVREEHEPNGYRVSRSVSCTLRDLTKFDDVLTTALRAGVTGVEGFSFRTSDLRQHRDAARITAVKAAREKAVLLATELGAKVGRALTVIEDQPTMGFGGLEWEPPQIPQNAIGRYSGGESEGGFAVGQIGISATVYVTFALE